jgi:hypothetical protein
LIANLHPINDSIPTFLHSLLRSVEKDIHRSSTVLADLIENNFMAIIPLVLLAAAILFIASTLIMVNRNSKKKRKNV